MPERSAYDWAIIRVVPRVERGECINAGVIVHCRARSFLAARVECARPRLQALWPDLDLDPLEEHLTSIPRICQGGKEAGPIGTLPMTDRFHWLVAPRSTIVQVSPVHAGLCEDPAGALAELFRKYVSH